MSGKKKYTIEEGKSLKIPKTTYSDNKTKKKKLKVAVTVKKGKKQYKTIAKKIRTATLKSKPVTIKFNDEGTYKISYTVTDQAKNKATSVRYVVVKEKEKEVVTTEEKTTEKATTEAPNKVPSKVPTEITTEAPNTEAPKTEIPTTEEPKEEIANEITISKDISRNQNIEQYVVNNITYYITDKSYTGLYTFKPELDYTIGFENNYSNIAMELDSDFLSTREYLKLLGKPIAYDSDGNDISNRIMVCDTSFVNDPATGGYSIFIVATDGNWNFNYKEIIVEIFDKGFDFPVASTDGSLKICDNPVIYATPKELTSTSGKKLVLKNNQNE